jgi:hypothetical protein
MFEWFHETESRIQDDLPSDTSTEKDAGFSPRYIRHFICQKFVDRDRTYLTNQQDISGK